MFSFESAGLPVPEVIRTMCVRTWHGLAAPGTSWSGPERIAIGTRARAKRLGVAPGPIDAPPEAIAAIDLLGAHPAATSREWVDGIVAGIGEAAYIEIVGIVARVTAIDTFTRLLGSAPEPFPAPRSGNPVPIDPPRNARKDHAWISMAGFPTPPFTLSFVPPEQDATNDTAAALYMTGEQMEDPDVTVDGLHRTQIEVVATAVSHRNECFY
jgi:hypothetical protein